MARRRMRALRNSARLPSCLPPGIRSEDGATPLMNAAHLGRTDLVKLLLEHGAKTDARTKKFGQTALMSAAGHQIGRRRHAPDERGSPWPDGPREAAARAWREDGCAH